MNIAKYFLDFYKPILNSPAHISENNENKSTAYYYGLLRRMFNSEIEPSEYLFDKNAIISNNNKDEEIYGLNEGKAKDKTNEFKIYHDDKIFEVKEALNIIFSFNIIFDMIGNKSFKLFKKKIIIL